MYEFLREKKREKKSSLWLGWIYWLNMNDHLKVCSHSTPFFSLPAFTRLWTEILVCLYSYLILYSWDITEPRRGLQMKEPVIQYSARPDQAPLMEITILIDEWLSCCNEITGRKSLRVILEGKNKMILAVLPSFFIMKDNGPALIGGLMRTLQWALPWVGSSGGLLLGR